MCSESGDHLKVDDYLTPKLRTRAEKEWRRIEASCEAYAKKSRIDGVRIRKLAKAEWDRDQCIKEK